MIYLIIYCLQRQKHPCLANKGQWVGSPQCRLTSVFDLVAPGGYLGSVAFVSGYWPGILPLELQRFPLSQGIDHKTLLAVTNTAVEPVTHLSRIFAFVANYLSQVLEILSS